MKEKKVWKKEPKLKKIFEDDYFLKLIRYDGTLKNSM